MREKRKPEQKPVERDADFRHRKVTKPERFSNMDGLIAYFVGDHVATKIVETAKGMGIGLVNLGKDNEDICGGIEIAAKKLRQRNKGYEGGPVYAVASLVLERNDMESAIGIIENMASRLEGNSKKHLTNVSGIMRAAKEFDLDLDDLGGIRREKTADEILRVAINTRYTDGKNGIAVVVLGQKAPEAIDIIVNKILPKQDSGSKIYSLGRFIEGSAHRKKVKIEDAELLLKAIWKRLEEVEKREVA